MIGASPRRGWAGRTHVPAIGAVPELRLAALATSDEATAEAASREWDLRGHADPVALIADPAVEVVVVAVKAPRPRPLGRGRAPQPQARAVRMAAGPEPR